tara:strand:+ start:11961 stop:12398 length:438 start_codon:yes stop_codon:yes gene_type:complete
MAATAGQLARSTGIEIQSFNVAASTSITRGQLVMLNASGHAVLATTAGTVARGVFVAVETVDNSSGSAGDLEIRCATGNTYVYATAGGAIKVGETVKADANSKCVVATAIFGSETHCGRYIGHENEESDPTDCVLNEVIIVRLGL